MQTSKSHTYKLILAINRYFTTGDYFGTATVLLDEDREILSILLAINKIKTQDKKEYSSLKNQLSKCKTRHKIVPKIGDKLFDCVLLQVELNRIDALAEELMNGEGTNPEYVAIVEKMLDSTSAKMIEIE